MHEVNGPQAEKLQYRHTVQLHKQHLENSICSGTSVVELVLPSGQLHVHHLKTNL